MAVPSGRSHERIAQAVVVELGHLDSRQSKETAFAQNVSSQGIRVATEHVWVPGDTVLVTSKDTGVHTQARVVYCQRLGNERFAIGLELLEPVKDWSRSN